MKRAPCKPSEGKDLFGTAFKREGLSASSFSSDGKHSSKKCQRKAILRHAISHAIVFMRGTVDFNFKASLSDARLSPSIMAPVSLSIVEKATQTKNNVKNS